MITEPNGALGGAMFLGKWKSPKDRCGRDGCGSPEGRKPQRLAGGGPRGFGGPRTAWRCVLGDRGL